MMTLAACGGGGSSGFGGAPPPGGGGGGWTPGVFLDAGTFFAHCAAPRAGIDPATNQPYPDVQGTSTDENNFLRSYSDDTYLWYDEITDRDPALHQTLDYFDGLKTDAITPSGQPKDNFHFTIPSDEWFALTQPGGIIAGYGVEWIIPTNTIPGEVFVAFTVPNTPGTSAPANLARGAELLSADGVDPLNVTTQAQFDRLLNALFPVGLGETYEFVVRDRDGMQRQFSMTSADIPAMPVQNVDTIPVAGGNVGYMLFNSHLEGAESGLINAVNQLRTAGIVDLVIDVRYNGGGFLDIASEFAYMIAGPVPTAGQDFEVLTFNDKHPTTDPVTGQPLSPTPFHTTTQGFDVMAGQALPTLNLSRVFVLTGPGTCSASESIMNGLMGVDVEVFQFGSTTCGKPYGFYATGNCGTTYFTIQFKGENAKGFGDYSDGFSAANQTGIVGTVVPGCSVADDFSQELGNPAEGRLAAALMYRENQTCPMPATGVAQPAQLLSVSGPTWSGVDTLVPRNALKQNRILRK
jgi:hypothetical protein